MSRLAGIDLGTTNSVLAAPVGRHVVVVPSAEGGRLTPSAVAATGAGGWVIGEAARRRAALDPENTATSIKRFVGVPLPARRDLAGRMPYWVVPGVDHEPLVFLPASGDAHLPEALAALILRRLRADAEAHLGARGDGAVIAVPAHFNAAQRHATVEAGRLAGLDVAALIDEPVAAALAYGLDEGPRTILVWNMGGGTY
jgi:molecular chaperone DnaK